MKTKHLISLFFLVFCVTIATAQKPRKIKKVSEKLSFSTAKYEVLKSNKNKKHGFYKEYDDYYRRLIVSGQYDLGKKEGFWKEWYQSEDLKSEGNYLNDEKVGVWVFYGDDGNLLHKYDYDEKTLLYSKECGNDKEYEVLINGESVWKTLDCPPSILGGMYILTVDIANTYLMSKGGNINNVGAIHAEISILIRKDGTVGDMKANKSFLNPDYIAILEEKINSNKSDWLPAKLDGEKVDAYVQLKSIISTKMRK